MYLLFTWLLAPLVLIRRWIEHSPKEPRHILLIQTAKIGDYICTTPLIGALREHFPHARLSLLVCPLTEPLAKYQPEVDSVFTLRNGQIRGFYGRLALYRLLRREEIDATICISPNQAFLLIPFLAGTRLRAGILPNNAGMSYRLSRPFLSVSETHIRGRMMVETGDALLNRIGIVGELKAKKITPAPGAYHRIATAFPELQKGSWIGLGISSGNKLKELGKETLTSLIKVLLTQESQFGVALIGSSADSNLAKKLLASVNADQVIDTTGRVALEDLAALIDGLITYIGVDSGITYLADARDIPVVDIMGPADPQDQRPTGKRAIIIPTMLDCAPCSHAFLSPYSCAKGTRECVKEVDIRRIVNTIQEAIPDEARRL